MVRYLVRCAHCDRAFWQADRAAPVPAHSRWSRRVAHRIAPRQGPARQAGPLPAAEERCAGSERPGYWIGEGEGPLTEGRR